MKKIGKIGLVCLFLLGILLVLYPTISNWLAICQASSAAQTYGNHVVGMSQSELEFQWKKARAYNKQLAEGFMPTQEMYNTVLNPSGNGIMGSLEIPSINIDLPIWHGCTDTVISKGVGHIEQTALPIGGQGTHAVLTSHTGLPSAKLFTDLHKVKIGERFYITVLNQCLTYEIISMDTVLPEEANRLKAVENEDLVTLVTCTPYGVNDHRLLVRGRRYVENNSGPSPMSSVKLPKEVAFLILLPLGIVSLLIFVIIHK